jgi:HK97 family phage major capsid protein
MTPEEMRKHVDELRGEQSKVIGECREMLDKARTEKRTLTADEDTAYQALVTTANELKTTISRAATQLDLETDLAAPRRKAPLADVRSGAGAGAGGEKLDAATVLNLHPKERQQYSLIRAFRAYGRGRWDDAPFELECHEALENHHKRQAMGFFVPSEALLVEQHHYGMSDTEVRRFLDATMSAMGAGGEQRIIGKVAPTTFGAALVATDLLTGSFIELLRNRTLVAQMGATILPNLVGDVDIPRQSAGAVSGWVATEGGAVGTDDVETDTVALTPRTVGIFTDITRRMLKQSSLGIEALVRRDIQQSIAVAIDLGAINGSGASGQPTGILQTSGVGLVTIGAAGTEEWADIVEFETLVSAANADRGALGFLVTSAIRGLLKTIEKATNTAVFLWESDRGPSEAEPRQTLNSYRALVTNQLPTGDMIFGNFNDLLIGEWGGLDMLADPYSIGTTGGLRIHGFQDVDVAVRHAASFAIAVDVI